MSTTTPIKDRLEDASRRIDRLEAKAEEMNDSARERAREEVRDIRREQDAVLERAAEARAASGERWRELNDR